MIGRFPNEISAMVLVFSILEGERLKQQKVKMRDDDIAWIEDASKALEQEPIRLKFLGGSFGCLRELTDMIRGYRI